MTREQKMQAVVDAARALHAYNAGYPAYQNLGDALAALDADAEAGETVTLAVWESVTGSADTCLAGTQRDTQDAHGILWNRLGTVTLPLTKERGA